MPQDPRKRQKAVMKKRSKQKNASLQKSLRQQAVSLSASAVIRRARAFPILECWISDSWEKESPGLVEIVVAREQPEGDICFGVFLVDKYCLGLKNTFARAGYSRRRYEDELQHIYQEMTQIACPPELAHQMVYASIEYAARFGFTPQKDFALSQYLLAVRGELEEPYNLEFGRDGKPFYLAGPHDNPKLILKQLNETAGEGNYDYLVMSPDMFTF